MTSMPGVTPGQVPGLIQPLPDGPLDIVGDIHGEYAALCRLLALLGYDAAGHHPAGRRLVFVGDFCDRGPDSPAVLALVERLVRGGTALAVLGNHEVNLLRDDAKDGAGWFFDARLERDGPKYAPFARPTAPQRLAIVAFLGTLPVGLERADLRVIHAAWIAPAVAAARAMPVTALRAEYDAGEQRAAVAAGALLPQMRAELAAWGHSLEQADVAPPYMPAHADSEVLKQGTNPLKVLTSGVERQAVAPFFASGKWRFVDRVRWWDSYDDSVPVVMGHYWRRVAPAGHGKDHADLFSGIGPERWLGRRGNVFCVDFSVGARWAARRAGQPPRHDFKLAALQWPERLLRFDDGSVLPTQGFSDGTGL